MNPPAGLSACTPRHRFSTWRAACRAASRSLGEAGCPRRADGLIRCGTESSKRSDRSPVATKSSRISMTGPGWVKFRPWEQAFLMVQGGVRRARMEILRHVIGLEHRHRARARGRNRQRREPGVPAAGMDRLWRRHRPNPARGVPAPPSRDGRAPGLGRGREPSVRRRDFRRLLVGRRVQLLSATTRRPCAKCAA